ncbi:MAG: type II toxin-antitoxin system RelE/ParE family toxin [Solimonas sp.]
MKLVLTEAAKADLIAIGDFIALDNPVRAGSFVDELLDRCESLAELPRAFPLVPRYEHWNIRRRVHGAYLIFYRIDDDVIHVIHILNGAQDFEALLFPDN